MSSLLSAAAVSLQDQLWSLPEDPGYFRQFVLDRREHRQELIVDTSGKKHPDLQPHGEDVFWQHIIANVVCESYLRLETFSELSRQAQYLRELQIKHKSQIAADRTLPEDYLDALLKFRHYLSQAAKGPLEMLKMHVRSSPPFCPFFVRSPPENPSSPFIEVQSKGLKMGRIENQLLWLLQKLWEEDSDLFFLQMPLVVDELQRLLEKEQTANNMITEFISSIIGDLAIICECLRQIDGYQPWALTFEDLMVEKASSIKEHFAKISKPWAGMLADLKEPNWSMRMAQLGKPTDKKFDCPVWKLRTKENTEIMRQLEVNLDAFWSHIDGRMNKEAGDLVGTAVGKLLTQSRILQRTPPWSEPDKPDKKSSDSDIQSTLMPFSDLYFNSSPELHEHCAVLARRVQHRRSRPEECLQALEQMLLPRLRQIRPILSQYLLWITVPSRSSGRCSSHLRLPPCRVKWHGMILCTQ
jgi:hypothetical protein